MSPLHLFDLPTVQLVYSGDPPNAVPMKWYGEYLWAAPLPAGVTQYQVCATDRAGNQACVQGGNVPAADDVPVDHPDAGVPIACPDGSHSCSGAGCCDAGGDARGSVLLVLLVGGVLVRRKRATAAAR